MSKATAQQQVQFYKAGDSARLSNATLKLYKSKVVLIDENNTKTRVPFTHSVVVLLAPSSSGFYIRVGDDQLTIFAPNAEQWVKLLNFYVVRYLIQKKHVHPLTMLEYGLGTCNACSDILHDRLEQCSTFCCEFCVGHEVLCNECYGRVDSLLSRSVRSNAHKHELYRFDQSPVKRLDQYSHICSKCNGLCGYQDEYKELKLTGRIMDPTPTFHCLKCLDYVECLKCFQAVETVGVHESLDLKHFSEYLNVITDQEISIKNDVQIPANISLVTKGYWDLSQIAIQPVDNAYFEVEFLSFDPDAIVGIGVGNEIFTSHALLGNQQNSMGYYNNGEMRRNIDLERKDLAFNPGDTIGCGVLLDNYSQRHIYFTLNGKLLDKSMRVHDGMNCYPGVCFTKESLVHFKTNFKGPFKFDLKTVPNYRGNIVNYFELLPPEVMGLFLQFMARTPLAVFAQMQQVCTTWRDYLMDNNLWRDAFIRRWSNQNPRAKIQNWKLFYKKRKEAIGVGDMKRVDNKPIENCNFEFECPLLWANLTGTYETGVAHCKVCNKNVYAVSDRATLLAYTQMGRCVAFNPTELRLPLNRYDHWEGVIRTGGRMVPLSDDDDDEDYDDDWD